MESMKKDSKIKIYWIVIACLGIWGVLSSPLYDVFLQNKQNAIGCIIILDVIISGVYLFVGGVHCQKVSKVLFWNGFLMQALYVLSTDYNISPHDLGGFADLQSNSSGSGHLGYMEYLYQHGHLPDFDPRAVNSFYNPPLFYIMEAVWLRINHSLGFGMEVCVNNLRVLTLFFSTLALCFCHRIVYYCRIKEKYKCVLMALLAFFPTFYLFAGSLATDSLVLLFLTLSIFYTIRWYEQHTMKNIIILALSIGLGMMTKASVGLIAPAVASVFLFVLIQEKENWKELMKQFILFGVICIPLGLFWMVRCKLLYDMPLTYVPMISSDSFQYIGETTLWRRLGIPRWRQMVYPKTMLSPSYDCNIWMQMFRTALFDEQNTVIMPSELYTKAGTILLYCHITLAIIMNICYCYIGKVKQLFRKPLWLFSIILYLTMFGSYIKFCFQYPHVCTMNYRYIAVLIIIPCVGMGYYMEQGKNPIKKYIGWIWTGLVTIVSILSILIYLRYYVITL